MKQEIITLYNIITSRTIFRVNLDSRVCLSLKEPRETQANSIVEVHSLIKKTRRKVLSLKLVVKLEYQNAQTFLQKVMPQINMKNFF